MDGRVGEVRPRPGVTAAAMRPLLAVGVGVLTGGFAAWPTTTTSSAEPTPWSPARSRRAGSVCRSLCTARGRR
ncbi:hypothetical protein SAMN05660657_04569 [Geodermatophilus amargosae]|uniref:Uncharacterized protein n=1 Tax=Geodermatophilus amargosae TaxID=1296565 RepID=A0A1I7CK84_9ACTN|nr:hypothetical protein SAMN05660657_04569 [Geodermatophilus amargosae]